ncbi:MAG: bifunctional 2-methylcitrate synthase/citrate synthase [Bythopirellula sp.]|nr:bifunctional 2-methylcitrate synthase/citrate synthase [Bythopirellula sp.]
MSDYDKFVAKKGLEGIVFDTSAISNVQAADKALYYRGYLVQDLAENCSYEETAYLLMHGELPTVSQLERFSQTERASRELSPALLEVIERFPRKGHPMDSIRTVVSYLGMEPEFAGDETAESALAKGLLLLAKIPTAIAAFQRIRRGKPAIVPRKDLSIAANFFHMCFGEVPDPVIVKAFDGSLTMYAEHSFNASTFTARVVVSTLADLCGAVTGAIASLKGPLHGGANEEVMYMLQEVGTPEKAKAWLDEKLATKQKIMGFGHRIYRFGDSRVPTMTKYRDQMAELKGGQKWVEISNILEEQMVAQKKIYPNLDFPAGPAYFLMGFEIDLFTPIFVMARTAGWVAHVSEQLADNRLVRPLAEYIGPAPRKSVPLAERV